MPRIVETLLTTLNAKGEAHIAPLGLIDDGGTGWIVAPFRPSRTLDNLMANPFAVASHVDDVRVFAGCITGRRDWPLVKADTVNGVRLESAVSHWELKVGRLTDHEQRPKFHCQIVHSGSHRPWPGFNRAQAAVLELAVLSTRLGMLSPEKVEAELRYLQIAIDKTAGDREHEAWGWLMERIDAWRRGDDKATKKN